MNLDFILIKCIKNRKKKLQATDNFFRKRIDLMHSSYLERHAFERVFLVLFFNKQ